MEAVQCEIPEGMTRERFDRGPVAVFECRQGISCNPCAAICSRNAVRMDTISGIPQVDYERCNGCGLCMSVCPGLAIFHIDMNYSEQTALLKLPYEMLPLPEAGSYVKGCDRQGRVLGEFRVVKVREERKGSFTWIVSLEIPKEYAMQVRNIVTEDWKL